MNSLAKILQKFASGELSLAQTQQTLESYHYECIHGATIDHGRSARCGFSEVIYAQGKPPALIGELIERLIAHDPPVLATRLAPDVLSQLDLSAWHTRYDRESRTLRVATDAKQLEPVDESSTSLRPIAVITAGSTDANVAREAIETLHWMRVPVRELTDVGVAGPQRLLSQLDQLERCAAAVVVAGMEGALPSVVAGHVGYPIIAVPTSIGYGVSLGGITALFSMLSSCAANVAVVNIDAGFKGGYLAGMISHGQTLDRC